MATQPVEIHLQLAALARTTSAPVGYVHWTRAQARRPWGWEYLERLHFVTRGAASRLRSIQRPSWWALLAVAAAAALCVWWVMRERMPAIDPQAVIVKHLAAADEALADRRYLEPLDHSALHHLRTVLAIDPDNVRARSGLAALAERFVEEARTSILDRRLADAVVALDALRRVAPDHRRLALLEVQLRRAIDQAASVRALEAQNAKVAQAAALAASATSSPAAPRRAPAPAPAASEPREPVKQLAAAPAPAASKAPTTQSGSPPDAAVPNESAASAEVAAPLAATLAAAGTNEIAPAPQIAAASTGSTGSTGSVGSAASTESASTESAGANTAPPPAAVARKLTRYVAPDYPREALLRGIEGWVDLDLTINAAGDVIASNVVGGKAKQVFDRAAASAVRRWKYEPRTDAEPFQALQVRVTFELEE